MQATQTDQADSSAAPVNGQAMLAAKDALLAAETNLLTLQLARISGHPSSQAAIEALLHRATTGMLFDISMPRHITPTLDFWQAYARALRDLQRGAGQKLADKDARLGGYAAPRHLRAAAGVLGVDLYRLSRVEIEDRLAQAGIKVPFDVVAWSDVEAAKQLEDGAVAPVNLDEKHSVARVDSDDGSGLHGSPLVVGAEILTDGMQIGDVFVPKQASLRAKTRSHYTQAQQDAALRLYHLVKRHPGTSGSNAAARLLLGLYNARRFPFELTDLRVFDPENLEAALIVLRMDATRTWTEIHDLLNAILEVSYVGDQFEVWAYDLRLKGRCTKEGYLELCKRVPA